jgi:hypothetical protein
MIGQPTILVLTNDGPTGRLIQWFTGGPASHVAIGLGDHALHAHREGVALEPRTTIGEHGYRLLAEYRVLRDVRLGLTYALQQLGKPYDVGDVLGWPFRARRAHWRLDGHRPRWTCVRLVLVLDPDRRQIPEWALLDPGKVTPTDLWRSLEGPSFVRIA